MSKIEKQEFLRKQIIDKGFDSSKFIKFLEENKEKQSELDKWTMDDLKAAIKKFKAKEEDNTDNDSVSSVESGLEDKVFGKKDK
jgi:hypothetical protein